MDYQNLLGNGWDNNYFRVENSDLYVVNPSDVVYVNSSYTEGGANDGHIWGTNAFADHESAKLNNPQKIVTTGGEISGKQGFDGITGEIQTGTFDNYVYGGNADMDASVAHTSNLTITDGSFVRAFGGNLVNANRQFVDVEQSSTLTINGGTFAAAVAGGDHVKDGIVTRKSDITLNIAGGTFEKTVAGGMLFDVAKDQSGASVACSNINVNISGGSFAKRFFAGNVSAYVVQSGNAKVNGNIALTIDASANNVSFAENIVAGSSGYSYVDGNVAVTLKKAATNEFNFKGILSGGSEGATYVTVDGVRNANSFVTGTRTLTFDSYVGEFGGTVFMFENVDFINDSTVNFTNAKLNLSDISDWDFEFGSSLSGLSRNDFSGDTLNFDLTGWDKSDWTVMEGSSSAFSGLESATEVMFGSTKATWDADLSAWCSTDYKLALSDEGESKKLTLSSLLA